MYMRINLPSSREASEFDGSLCRIPLDSLKVPQGFPWMPLLIKCPRNSPRIPLERFGKDNLRLHFRWGGEGFLCLSLSGALATRAPLIKGAEVHPLN